MPSKIILDPTEPGMKEVLSGLTSGQTITLSEVEVTVDRNDDNVFEATVDSVSVESEGGNEREAEAKAVKPEEIPPASNSANPGKFDMGAGS